MSLADQKLLAWLIKGPVEYNKIGREIDFKLLNEALDPDYKPIFKIVDDYYSRYKTPPSFQVMKDNLIQDEELYYLATLIEEERCPESEVLFYLDQIRNRFNSQLASRLAKSIPKDLTDIDIEEFNSNMLSISAKIDRLKRSAVFSEGDFINSTKDRFDDYIFTEANPNLAAGVLSGFPAIDEYTYGIKKSELMIISGASSSGKSLLMMNYALNAWKGSNDPLDPLSDRIDDGKNILYFSLEMSKKQMEQRMDANLADIRHKAISRGFLTTEEKQRWKLSLEFQRKYNKHFYIVDMPRGSRTIDIEARFDSISAEFDPDLVVVDYLGIMKPNRDFGQDWLEVGHVAADLHEFCRSKNLAVLTAAQRKTQDKKDKGKSGDLTDLGRSKLIGDNANIVLLIEEREDERLREDAILTFVKNRDGEKGELRLLKEFEKSKFSSIPDNWSLSNLGDENAI